VVFGGVSPGTEWRFNLNETEPPSRVKADSDGRIVLDLPNTATVKLQKN
jgi:hypothetical protein